MDTLLLPRPDPDLAPSDTVALCNLRCNYCCFSASKPLRDELAGIHLRELRDGARAS